MMSDETTVNIKVTMNKRWIPHFIAFLRPSTCDPEGLGWRPKEDRKVDWMYDAG
jgi:hypothetical protein